MDLQHDQQRGRSPSTGHGPHISHSPSPHAPYDTTVHDQSFSTGAQLDSAQYLSSIQAPFLHTTQGLSQHNTPLFAPQSTNISPDPLDITAFSGQDFSSPDFSNQDYTFFPTQPQFNNTLDPHVLDHQQQQQQQQQQLSVNPNDLMTQMASQPAPTPPHLLPTMNTQRSPSPHASPNLNQGGFPSPGHSRNASLDPSAAYHGTEWANMANFRGHRRAPSETYSDISSAHQSPYLPHHDSFEEAQPSPLLNAQTDPQLFHDPTMQFGQFTLNDNSHISPSPSPHISPRLMPQQQSLPQFQPGSFGIENNYQGDNFQGMYQTEPFPALPAEFGQADTMSPPEINIDFAPPSRQASFEPPKPGNHADALSPPDRSRSRNRIRAKSDPFSGGSRTPEVIRSLSPSAAKSRSPSPSGKSSRRSSTSSVPNRDYILDLADPTRPVPADGNPKRTQKHPATFQCTLCPKRFTRAYNLRSHLRTHTDERPFVCSVCGKAFARQHDRKRHEGLHSGEKKFVCRGNLKDNNHWGCNRRFARADALGRHFRSEAGRVCIRPLLEEEAQEKGGWEQQPNPSAFPQQNFGMQQPQAFPQMAPQPFLPAALLAQYPALATMDWNQLPTTDEIEGDISGRSSFDASSGGELFDEESDYQSTAYNTNSGWASDSYDGR